MSHKPVRGTNLGEIGCTQNLFDSVTGFIDNHDKFKKDSLLDYYKRLSFGNLTFKKGVWYNENV